MKVAAILALIAGAALGGWWMWRRTTATLYHRSPNPTIRPANMTPADYDAWVVVRRKRSRLLKSAGAAAVGAAAVSLLVVMADSGLSRR